MEWTRGPTIGRGATATVYLAADRSSGEQFAVKSTELSCSVFLQREQSFLSMLNSCRIVKYLGFSITTENNRLTYNLCMEYVSGGTLSDVIQRRRGKLDESLIKLYTRQILQGLDHLHGNGLAHCDIKSRNILVGEEGIKIADLGCAKMVEKVDGVEDLDASKFSGTPVFMAPEVARGEEQGFAADIWALGCVIIEMATGGGPWPETNDPVSALYRIGYSDAVPEFPSLFSEEGKDFLGNCLKRNSNDRWTAKELLEHPFLQGLEFQFEQVKVEKTNSPSSVLDKDLWDSLEVFSESRVELEFEGSFSISAEERIKMLIDNTFSRLPNRPDWSTTFGDYWLTVRSNGSNEEDTILDATPTSMASIIHEEEHVDSSIYDEELSFDYSDEIISTVSSDQSSFMIPCNNLLKLKNEIDRKTSSFVKSQCYYAVFNPFFLFCFVFLFHLFQYSMFICSLSHALSSFNFARNIGTLNAFLRFLFSEKYNCSVI